MDGLLARSSVSVIHGAIVITSSVKELAPNALFTMRLTYRLLAAILPIVVIVMGALAAGFAYERQRVFDPEVQQQTRAYARALDLAFEYALRDLDGQRVQVLLNRMSADPRVYGVRVYGPDGAVRFASSAMQAAPVIPDSVLERVQASGSEVVFENPIANEKVFSVLRPLHETISLSNDGETAPRGPVVGVMEVAQPYAVLAGEVRLLQRELLLATVILLATVAIAVGVMSKRLVARPLERLVDAARALGEGRSDVRVPLTLGAAEPNALAREFNQMADRLEQANRDLVAQSEGQVKLERRLVEAEKLATVGTLAAGLAHEIGAPLNVISVRAERMLSQTGNEPEATRQLESIVTQSGRIARTVRSLLNYAQGPARADVPVVIGSVVDGSLELLEDDIARTQVTITRTGSFDVQIRGDAEQLQQVMTNLVLNALQAMDGQPDPREIEIAVRTDRAEGHTSQTNVTLTVSDTGPGLAASLDGRLFMPFATTKPAGTGLGLVVARSVIEDHRGTLIGTIRDDGVRGAVFTAVLPLYRDETDAQH